MLRHCFFVFSIFVALSQISAAATPKSSPDQFVDQIIANERALSSTMRNYSPMVETYLQRLQQDPNLGLVPGEDHYFLGRVLGLTQYLNESHLLKQGMRFWFCNDRASSLEQCSEIGGRYLSRIPAFQVDRSTLDEEVLRRAQAAGAELVRPAAVQKVTLTPGGQQTVVLRQEESTKTLSARWVVDASGPAALLSRQNGWWRANHAHPTTAGWSRWRGVTSSPGDR